MLEISICLPQILIGIKWKETFFKDVDVYPCTIFVIRVVPTKNKFYTYFILGEN